MSSLPDRIPNGSESHTKEDFAFLDFVIQRAIESAMAEARARRRKESRTRVDVDTV